VSKSSKGNSNAFESKGKKKGRRRQTGGTTPYQKKPQWVDVEAARIVV